MGRGAWRAKVHRVPKCQTRLKWLSTHAQNLLLGLNHMKEVNISEWDIPSEILFYSFVFQLLVQFSHSVVSDSLQPYGLQHARLPCLSPSSGVYPNSCPLSQWCHPTISSSAIPFSSHLHLSQHQGLFKWVNSSHRVAKVLEFQLQHQSFQWIFRRDLL